MPANELTLQKKHANLMAKQIPLIWLINIFMPVVLIVGIWDPARSLWMQAWLGLIFGVSGLRFAFHLKMQQWANDGVAPLNRMRMLSVLSGISGIAWGCSALLLGDSATSIDHMLLGITLLLMAGGSMASLGFYYPAMLAYTQPGFYYPAMLAYALPALLPQTLFMLSNGDQISVSIGGIMLAFTLFCLFIARNSNRTLLNSMHLQQEKDQLLKQVHEQKALIEEASLAKTRFLAAASHDLRQPLHAITLLLATLKLSDNDADRNELCSKIDTSVDNLTELFDALLDISKLDAAAIEVNPQPMALAPTFARLQQQFQAEADAKQLKLRVRAAGLVVLSDPLWLQRILGNLLSNALCYTALGGVILAARPRGSEVEIQVWDSGRGIAAPDQQRIFTEFEQLYNPQRDRSQGLGLGLSIVRRLSELLGHDIALVSELDQGAMFSIRCPAATLAHTAPQRPEVSHPDRLRGRKVLLIDDDASVRDSMAVLLSKWHCEVQAVGSMEELRELMSGGAYAPDLVISDYRLQENSTGVQALELVRSQFENPPPGVLISADTAPESIAHAIESGYQLLHKPVKPAQLRTCLNRALIS